MLRDHCAGIDVCLCGWRGVGKTALARCFADALGYRVRTIFCYKDMGARDFLQRRVTDDRGNTGWKDSALVDAALRGDVAVLDGVDRLPRGLLYATLARLVSDRELDLPDGTRLCAPRRWAELLHGGLSETDLRARGLRRVSPSFRVVAIAGSVPSGTRDDRRGQWLDPELASLFHFHVAPVFEPNDERKLMKRELGPAPDGDVVVDVLLSYNKSIRDHAYQRDKLAMEKKVAAPATSLALCALSLRQFSRSWRSAGAAPAPDYAERRGVEHLVLGDVAAPTRAPARPELVPDPLFVPIHSHMWLLRDALLDWRAGHHLLFIGNQGVGKNKIADELLHLLRCEREYVQLHRDTTVGSLTSAPVLSDGVVSRGDSPLVRALRHGRCLVVDEADKAPLEVVCILKALVEDGDLQLADGRRSLGGHAAEADDDTLWIDDAFRMIVLANRPGRPFQGNDFYRECGDAFASFGVDNPEVRSEVAMLKAYAPAVPDALVTKLSTTFGKLRDLAESPQAWEQRDEARLAYPYSARELVKVCEHLNAFADDGVDAALADVFAFDAHVPPLKVTLDNALKQDGFVMCGAMREDDDENFAADEKRALRKRREAGVDLTKLALDVDESAVVVADARGGSVAAAKRRGDAALKLALKHDMFLIGDPGPRPRALVLQFCELLGRECEFVALTRDTSEGDLKQRREIRDGAFVWANQPPVLAALHGRVLVLQGVERAERNVLPLLNNLLENREMALDDGTFLMDAKRFDALCAEDAERASGLVDGEEGRVELEKARASKRVLRSAAPPLAHRRAVLDKTKKLCAMVSALRRLWEPSLRKTARMRRNAAAAKSGGEVHVPDWVPDWRADQVMREQPTAARPWAPDGAVESTAALLAAFPRLPPGAALKRAYCYDLLESLKLDADGRAELDAWLDDAGFDVVEAEDPRGSTPFGPTPRLAGKVAAPAGERVPREASKPKKAGAEAPEFAAPRTDGAPAAEPAPNVARAALARRLRGDSDSDSDSEFDDADGRRVRVRYDADGRRLDDGASSESDESLDADGMPVGRGDDDSDDDDASLDADGVAVAKAAPSAAVLAARAKLLRVSGDADAGVNVAAEEGSSDSETSSLAGLELDYAHADDPDSGAARRLLSFRTADGDEVRAVAVAGAGAEAPSAPSILSGSQRRVLGAMVQDHVVGVDLCVVGERGVGKTLVIRDFAAALGYRCRTVFCYKDMGARDLTMRRVTDARGNTEWRRSPLIEAALDGGLAVLDGAHRLAPGVLRSTLGRLLSDREIQLPDGTRLVSPAAYAALREIYDDAALQAKGVLRAHPAFRVVCAGEPPSAHNPWISAELAGLMHYHYLAPLSSAEQTSLVRHALEAGGAGEPRALAAGEERALLDYGDALRRAVATESILEPLLLTARRLAQIGAHLRSRPQDGVEDAVDHIFAAYQDFLPAPKRATARRMLRDALVTRGVPTAKERGGASFGRRVSRKRDRAASARCHVAPCVTAGAGSTFYLGDAAGEKRSPRRRDLVPRPPFGVGKNKLADRLLQLLDAEREYVQLHRDTTVQALTASPTLKGGVVVWEDSPLVKAARHGRCLVVDEADKAPLEVVCVLKALVDDGELQLADGRRLARPAATATPAPTPRRTPRRARRATCPWRRASASSSSRTGRASLLGNDFYRECGDAFACHAVENADEASEVQMLRRYGPGVRVKQVVKLTQAFKKLRAMYDDGAISYPYSSRELVKLVQHLDRFPADGLRGAVADVFGFDAQDPQLHAKLMSVLDAVEESRHEAEAEKPPPPPKAKDDVADKNTKDGEEGPNTRVEYTDKPDGDGASAKTPEGAEGRDAGREAKREAQGTAKATQDGVTPAGEGSGEAKAAEAQALGFKDGPAAAGGAEDVEAKDDAGAPASTEPRGRATADPGGAARIKDERPVASEGETSEERAQREKVTSALGAEDRRKTLHQLQMTEKDARQYEKLYAAVESQVGVLRAALLGREARERERTWKRLQTHGELDELMLVDGITGATNIYKRRSPDDAARLLSQQLPKRIKFVLDISGSMYTYNRLDGRLTRALQALIMLMEALDGFEHKYEYSVVGHSGAASAVLLVPWGSPPKTRLERLKLVRKMVTHAQTCKSGDHTLQATKRAVADVAAKAADEYFVFLLSDADFGRYDLTGRDLGAALTADPRVSAYALFIASNFEAAEAIKDERPPGKGLLLRRPAHRHARDGRPSSSKHSARGF
ncbi:ATPase [Aureococcus anophagefferens]|nr:ATPase [Aureococcus anophagefferens]